jgi:hypothetical protein
MPERLTERPMICCRLRESQGVCSTATATAFACPACATLELARSCSSFVTSVVNGNDLVPCFNAVTMEHLRQEVMESDWFDSFRSDLRSSSILYRAAETSFHAVGYGTYWAASGLLAVTRATGSLFQACATARYGSSQYAFSFCHAVSLCRRATLCVKRLPRKTYADCKFAAGYDAVLYAHQALFWALMA